ncbi:MAG: hypothetical protein QMD04_12765 [Anaerolineales bacterium]|nr:hypothetical protein [Anaerolineales bacterium]
MKITGPTCGDGSCNGSENCSSCPGDCGACCTPSCSSPYCGQGDGCGGTCASTDAGAPGAPALNPVNGGTVTVSEGQQATASWSAPAKADSYELQLYPAGTNCSALGAYCSSTGSLAYSFEPLYSQYYYRVRGINTTCATEHGNWATGRPLCNPPNLW